MKMTDQDVLTLTIADAEVTLNGKALGALWIEKVRGQSRTSAPLPKIGVKSELGVFVGLVRGEESEFQGRGDYFLYDMGEAPERLAHKPALEWAVALGGDLPLRREQALLFANRGKGQFKDEYYWSKELPESDRGYAWLPDLRAWPPDLQPHGLRLSCPRRPQGVPQ